MKYYWLKLKNDFFTQPKIKKLRKIAGGDTYTIIYLKMQLLSLKNDGRLIFEGIEDDFASEIALTIDEDPENVAITIQYLLAQGLMEQIPESEYIMTETQTLIGSESDSAPRVRRHRERQKALQCNADVTRCNTEIEIEKEIDIEIDKREENKGRKKFAPPSVDEVRSYCQERKNSIDAQSFVDFYESKGWMVGKNKMKDWKAAVRTWERRRERTSVDTGREAAEPETFSDELRRMAEADNRPFEGW